VRGPAVAFHAVLLRIQHTRPALDGASRCASPQLFFLLRFRSSRGGRAEEESGRAAAAGSISIVRAEHVPQSLKQLLLARSTGSNTHAFVARNRSQLVAV
jgi:hypothetical protein